MTLHSVIAFVFFFKLLYSISVARGSVQVCVDKRRSESHSSGQLQLSTFHNLVSGLTMKNHRQSQCYKIHVARQLHSLIKML